MSTAAVIVVGAGPTGLMLAYELRLAGVDVTVVERRPGPRSKPKANGLSGQILDVLAFRGLLAECETEAGSPVRPATGFPFGTLQINARHVRDNPLRVLGLAQQQLEDVLNRHVRDLGATFLANHELRSVDQDLNTVYAQLSGPDGPLTISGRFLVGCDGGRSRTRDSAGIGFVGETHAEVQRLCEIEVPSWLTVCQNDDLMAPGLATIHAGVTRTDTGIFAYGRLRSGRLLIQTTEDQLTDDTADHGDAAYEHDVGPLTADAMRQSIRRVLRADFPIERPRRLSSYRFRARLAQTYRRGRILLAGDAAHSFPATGVGINAGMSDAVNLGWKLAGAVHGWAPPALLDTYHHERHAAASSLLRLTQAQVALRRHDDAAARALRELFTDLMHDQQPVQRLAAAIAGTDNRYDNPQISNAPRMPLAGRFVPNLSLHTEHGATDITQLMHSARPVFLNLGTSTILTEACDRWRHRVDLHDARTSDSELAALLIRPDGYIAWSASEGDNPTMAVNTLTTVLRQWFGEPRTDQEPSDNPYPDEGAML
jgi:2-polyprenyl-6-methoxyphenol hydroxylase-like FAD-dependent oxidoreductase